MENHPFVRETSVMTAFGGVDYLWNTGQRTPTIEVTAGGLYSVVVTDNNGCSATVQKEVAVTPLPAATVNDLSEICQGQEATLTVSAPAGCSYLWSTGSRMSQISVHDAGVYSAAARARITPQWLSMSCRKSISLEQARSVTASQPCLPFQVQVRCNMNGVMEIRISLS